MNCAIELDGCLGGGGVAHFHVKRFGQPGFAKCCSECWRQLVGTERTVEQPKNVATLPRVPRRAAPTSEVLSLYAPKKPPGADWL